MPLRQPSKFIGVSTGTVAPPRGVSEETPLVKVLASASFILGLIAMACGGAASPTIGVNPGAQQALEAAPVAGAFNADIKDFAHQDITVPVGTTVAWTNRDNVSHTTTEVSDTEIWDSFALQPGQSFSFTFTKAGTFNPGFPRSNQLSWI